MTYVLYAISMFAGAFLLFSVQPMLGRQLLPLLGGTPAVWNTCMVFYQTLLLAGYAYAHLSVRFLGLKVQSAVHLILLLLAAAVLPIGLSPHLSPPDVSRPIRWLLGALFLSAGLPFFLVSATAPLMQRWHASVKHSVGQRPYTLYAFSNLGSMAALLAYLLYMEPRMSRTGQSWAWTVVYGLLVFFMAACAVLLWRDLNHPDATRIDESSPHTAPLEIGNRERLKWVVLSFIPSSLLLGVTTHITTNVAPVPLMWVVPLILYLATFVIVFSGRRILPYRVMASLQPFLALPLALGAFWSMDPSQVIGMKYAIVLHLALFFVSSMICHGLLAESKPSTFNLTEFYVWLSLGGVLGGLFNALLAPVVFTRLVEYPLAIAAACFCRPSLSRKPANPSWTVDAVMAVTVLAAVAAMAVSLRVSHGSGMVIPVLHLASAGLTLAILLFRNRRWIFGTGVAALLLAGFLSQSSSNVLYTDRNFFGILRVYRDMFNDSVTLQHGSIVHGVQYQDPDNIREPQHYYARTEPFGLFFDTLLRIKSIKRVGVIGLGAGTMAAYGLPGQHWTFFEIDPAILQVAEDPKLFTYLADSRSRTDVTLGDGRLSLTREPDDSFDLIAIDAFSSDSIPVHLLTVEAMALYLEKLKVEGFLAFHVSNRYLSLAPVLSRLARQYGQDYLDCMVNSQWFFVGNSLEPFGHLVADQTCGKPDLPVGFPAWTDDSSSILSVFR